jgi:hypothetical protein
VVLTPLANLLRVSTTQEVLVAKFAIPVIDPGGKFAPGVFDTGDEPWLLRIFRKIHNATNATLFSGEDDLWKNLKQKISWHCPFHTKWSIFEEHFGYRR